MAKVNIKNYRFMNILKVKSSHGKFYFYGLLSKNKFLSRHIAKKCELTGRIKVKDILRLEKYENELQKKLLNKNPENLTEEQKYLIF